MQVQSSSPGAAAYLRGGSSTPDLFGIVKFYPHRQGTLVVADVFGLPQENNSDFFALHIHEGNRCAGDNFPETGGHYNPAKAPHPKHAGDLPPLLSCSGTAHLTVLTNRFSIPEIIGRTVVIHGGPDDFHSQPAGNAGIKIACGVIRSV